MTGILICQESRVPEPDSLASEKRKPGGQFRTPGSLGSARGLKTRTIFCSKSPLKSTMLGMERGSRAWTASVWPRKSESPRRISTAYLKQGLFAAGHRGDGSRNVLTKRHFNSHTAECPLTAILPAKPSSRATWESAGSGLAECLWASNETPAD